MFHCENDLLVNLVVLTPKLARRKFRQHIFEAWEWKCAYCDRQLSEGTATIDHIVPKHKGGQNIRSNLACACSNCNRSKASQQLFEWYHSGQSFYCEERLDKLKKWLEQKPQSIKLPSTGPAVPYFANDFYIGWVAT
jgi:CRISPR/Cas system Type II protein with McrA/HNH and RuvC-like nuclease domain